MNSETNNMAVQLSNYLWLRNNDFIPWIEDAHFNYNEPRLSKEDKKTLKFIVDELDDLHSESKFEDTNKPLVGPNVLLLGYTRYVEKSKKPEMSGKLFEGIFSIVRKYSVHPSVHRRLGDAFKDIGLEVPKYIEEAASYARILENTSPIHRKEISWDYFKKTRAK